MAVTMGTTEILARWIAATTYDEIPAAAIEQAKKSILDYIGTATYGTTSQLGKIMLEFIREQGGNPQARVIGTNIRTASAQAAFANGTIGHSEVKQGLEGKFSGAYNIAAAIIDGKVDYETFTDKRAARGDLQAFMKRVRLVRDNDVVLRRPHIADGNAEARLRITMRDGTVHDFVMEIARHLTGNAVLDKFRLNTERILGKERAATAIELVQRLEKVKDVAQLMDAVIIASPGKHARSAPVRRGEPALQAG